MAPPGRLRNRAGLFLAGVVLGAAVLFALGLSPPPSTPSDRIATPTDPDVDLARPAERGQTKLWPYTSRGRTFDRATLPINVVVHADATTVTRLLASGTGSEGGLYWNKQKAAWQSGTHSQANVTINGTGIHWGTSHGAARYTFFLTTERGVWRDATYQLSDGPYFGSRYHLRLYESGPENDRWTAIQAHHEYWDWFRLRHDVDSLARAQHYVEQDFMGTGLVADIRRERWGNGGAIDADGWVTVIELRPRVTGGPKFDLAPPTSVGGALAVGSLIWLSVPAVVGRLRALVRVGPGKSIRRRISSAHVGLFAGTMALPLVVRVGAITVEQTFPSASPVAVGGPFYLLLVCGLPGIAVLFGRHLPSSEGFTTAVVGFGVGIMADYAYLGLGAIPFGALVQRLVLLFGLGLLAAGGVRWSVDPLARHRYRVIGLGIWIAALLWPLR